MRELSDDNFKEEIASGVTLVDFSAEWCGPCRMLAPIIEEVASSMEGKASVVKVDIDKSQKVTAEYQVTSVPTMILFQNGEEINRIVGLKDAETLTEMITAAI